MSRPDSSLTKIVDRWLARRAAPIRPGIGRVVALGMGSGLLLMVQAALLAWILSAVVMEGAGLAKVWPALAAIPPVIALRYVLIRLSERVAFSAAATMRVALRNELLRKLQALGPMWLRGEASGALATHLVQGIEALEGYYARWMPGRALTVMLPLAILVVVFPVDWVSGIVLLVTAPLIPLFMILLGKSAADANRRQWKLLAVLGARFLDSLQGITTLKLFNASRREASVVARLSEAYRSSTMRVLRVAFLSSVVLEFLATLGIAVVAVLVGFHLFYGKIPLLRGLFVLLLAPEFYMPLRSLGSQYHERLDAIAAAERIMEIVDLPEPEEHGARAPLPAAEGYTIRFDDVSHDWSSERPALDRLNLVADAGRITALVGHSGAGKSTVLNLLLGFARATSGEISVNGQLLNDTDLDDWRSRVAWVPQRAHVFAGTVMQNLLIARPDADFDTVRAAASDAGADDFIQSLPNGYDTELGERGVGLSGGQIQRLALARAFLKDAPVLLLDEPTASLDVHTQASIHDSLRRLARGRTVLLIAHRMSTAALADTIVVMEHGKAVQSGSHEQLAASDGVYRRLIDAGIAAPDERAEVES
ncbi:thiol reductant ABC exporter subunit CydD [Paraburkholderia dinghuensis]|uniref:Thiol reductant ABC exporter subunit CydD n=1 Tax=Paraburkholderia dinghuensis TaxID=2305225 RepID=A0A3N6Q3M4_9BURK|nr:thiol reductant ABC exporter subunit CydD [Paraburkholderia dinghuensis]RQH06956.1 thiol reductant ABC exporter subunit CydD [Paraburkholderia dinghuensis]